MRYKNDVPGLAAVLAALTALVAAPAAVLAQETKPKSEESKPQGTKPPEEANNSSLLDTVYVTARKRASTEAVQDTPVAITAFTADQFDAIFANNLDDIGKLAPGVNLKPTSQVGGQNFTIRGMGVSGTTPSDEPAVGILQDGVYWGSNYGAMLETFDVESIEILRGPQGTLFGRNVTGGAVLVRTARPKGEFDFAAQTTIGDYGRRDFSVKLEGPLVQDKLAGKITVLDRSLDGYYRNIFLNNDFGKNDTRLIRGTLMATPTENFTATVILEQYRQKGDSTAAVGIEVVGNGPYNSGFRQPANWWDIRLDNPGKSDIDVDLGVLELNWNVAQGRVTSISGKRKVDVANTTDYDGSQFSFFNQSIGFKQDQFSQEVIYSSEFSGRVNFTAGVYYFEQEYTHTEGRDLNNHATITLTRANLKQDSYAAFGEMDVKLAPRWTLTLGGRFTDETKKAKSVPFTPAVTLCGTATIYNFGICSFPYGAQAEESWSDFSPKVVLGFKPADGHLFYGSVTRGFRSGGYSLRGNVIFSPFDSESVTAFEVGYKGDLAENRLRLNTAVYVNKYKDLQRTVLGTDPVFGVVQSTFNVADATIQGFEMDLIAQVTDHLVFTGGYSYTDAKYDRVVAGFSATNDFTRVPKNNWSASATYSFDIENFGNLAFRGGATFTDKQFFNDANTVSADSYTLLDASIDWLHSKGQWSAALFGKNLTNEKYSYWGSTLGNAGANAFTGAPRTWGLRIGYDF